MITPSPVHFMTSINSSKINLLLPVDLCTITPSQYCYGGLDHVRSRRSGGRAGYFRYCHIRSRRSRLKELSALKHLLFLPSLIALRVKESGAITAARIGSREAFKALTAV
jgi:hypothetical protein